MPATFACAAHIADDVGEILSRIAVVTGSGCGAADVIVVVVVVSGGGGVDWGQKRTERERGK